MIDEYDVYELTSILNELFDILEVPENASILDKATDVMVAYHEYEKTQGV